MADKTSRRVLRAYSLPLEHFDHLQTVKRQRQRDINRRTGILAQEGDPNWVSTSEALSGIVYVHRLLTSAAEREGVSIDQLVTAVRLGELVPARDRGEQLPNDAAAHLEAFGVACGHDRAIDTLAEIVRTHQTLSEMSIREGRLMSDISQGVKVANEWHAEGVRGAAVMPNAISATAH